MRNIDLRATLAVGSAVLAASLVASAAAPTVDQIPFAPHGDHIGRGSNVLPLTPTTLVVAAEGDDLDALTADDKVLIVTGVGGTPTVTATVVGGFSTNGCRWTRLSATRAYIPNAGTDGTFGTADDELLVLNGIGSTNTFTRVVVGRLQTGSGAANAGARLTPDTVVVPTIDDTVALITDIAGTPTVAHLPAPNLSSGGRAAPTVLSPTSFAIASNGPDGSNLTDDDVVYVFTGVGGANTRTDLTVPWLHDGHPGQPVRVTSSKVVVISAGPDASTETDDDRLYVLRGLGGTTSSEMVPMGTLSDYGASRPRALGPDLILVATWGEDDSEQTADDSLVVLTGLDGNLLDGTLVATEVVVGAMEEDGECRPVRLSGNRAAVVTFGPDTSTNNSDDRIAILSDAGGTNTVTHISVPGLLGRVPAEPLPLSTSALLVLSGGGDEVTDDTAIDDEYTVVTGIGTASASVDSTPLDPAGGKPIEGHGTAARLAYAGGGVAVSLGSGPDGIGFNGLDDVIEVISDLPAGRSVSVKKLLIKFKATKPQKGEKFVVKADLMLDDPSIFGMGDLTISIGNAAQTIAADAFVERKGKPRYKRPRGGDGFIKKVIYNPKRGTLTVTGKGIGTGGETTVAGYIPFTLDITDVLHVGQSLVGQAKKSGLKYKRPK